MTPQQELIKELEERYSEWFEQWPEYHDDILIQLLTCLVVKQRSDYEIYRNAWKKEMSSK